MSATVLTIALAVVAGCLRTLAWAFGIDLPPGVK